MLLTLVYLMVHTDEAAPSVSSKSEASARSPAVVPSGSAWADLTPPLSRESLGQATWAFLHTLAALYPTQPSAEQRRAANALLSSLSVLYPCPVCREHFSTFLQRQPPTVGSRVDLSHWLCTAHNDVNLRLDRAVSDAQYGAEGCRARRGACELMCMALLRCAVLLCV